jgi:hypothetical protein
MSARAWTGPRDQDGNAARAAAIAARACSASARANCPTTSATFEGLIFGDCSSVLAQSPLMKF